MKEVQEQDNDAYTALTETQQHKLTDDEVVLTAARDRAKQRSADAQAAVEAVARVKKDQEAAKAVLDQRISALTAEADALAADQTKLEELIKQRQAALKAARRTVAGVSPSGFIWPVNGVLTSGYGPRWGRMHTRIDIAAPSRYTDPGSQGRRGHLHRLSRGLRQHRPRRPRRRDRHALRPPVPHRLRRGPNPQPG